MKNKISIAFALICLGVTVFGQKGQEPLQATYTMGFVFTGEILSTGDSLFSLQYTFAATEVSNLRKVILEDSRGQYQLSLSKAGSQGDMEIRTENDKVKVIVLKYERYNLPVLTQGEDNMGVKHPLYLAAGKGQRISSEQFKSQLKGTRELIEQNEQIRILETGQGK